MGKGNFVHLHLHSEYSLLDGFGAPRSIVKKVKELGMEAVALTDHGAMYGAVELYKAGREQGVKPIVGVEAYVTNEDHRVKDKNKKPETFHLILLAKDEEGYHNLMELTTIAHIEGYYYRPKFDKETLKKYAKGVICTSACMQGEIAQLLIDGDYGKARETAQWYREVFGEDYYLELQRHEYERFVDQAQNTEIAGDLKKMVRNERLIEEGVLKLSRELAIPVVATNDSHYIEQEDAEAQDALVCVATGKFVSDVNRIRYIDSPTYYIRAPSEMSALFADVPEAIENTVKLAAKCDLEISTFGQWHFPSVELEEGETPEDRLRKLVRDRTDGRYGEVSKEIQQRINYELDVILKKGYATYFLVMSDIVDWTHRRGIITNTRGSVAGSAVSYILGITTVDPIKYNLPFERFLNPFRPSPPDIDLDVADDRRDEVIAYITEKYGKDRVAQICTFGRMLARAAVRDVARVLSLPYATGDKIAKVIPPPKQGFPIDIPKAMELSPQLKELYDNDADAKRILDLAHKLEGSARHISVHAAGVVVSPTQMNHFTPLQLEPSGERVITQYEMNACEDVGLVKIDVLGISNLSTLGACRDIVKEVRGKEVDLANLPLDDKKTFEMLGRGETMGVFQMGSSGMTKYLVDLKPARVEDLMAMVALYRPGPIAVIPEYIARKRNPKLVKYLDPRMEKFLDQSYGLLVYQDDLLFCALELAGYTWEEADKFRKAVGKKIPAEMAAQKQKFIKGIVENGQTKEFAHELWKLFEPFQAYGFNKAHAASYGIVAYQTAYMKANYPVEFMTALLTAESGSSEKLAEGVAEAKRLGVKILPPDINKSRVVFMIEKDKESLDGRAIRFGLSAIKNVGEAAVENILAAREEGEFGSLSDFLRRVDSRKVNRKVLESLIKAGAMDAFGLRAAMLTSIDVIREKAAIFAKQSQEGQDSLFAGEEEGEQQELSDNLPQVEEFSQDEKLSFERELLGLYLTEHPLTAALAQIAHRVTHKLYQIDPQEHDGQKVRVGGVVASQRVVVTKRSQEEMAFVTFEDDTGSCEMVVFPEVFKKTRDYWLSRNPILVEGKVENRDESMSVLVDAVYGVDEAGGGSGGAVFNADDGAVTLRIPRGVRSQALVQINSLLQENKGGDTLVIVVENGSAEKRIKLPYGVSWSKALEEEIKGLLGKPD